MKRSERIKRAYEYLRFQGIVGSQDDVANKMKRQRTNVSSALNGNEKYLTDKFVKDFCKTFGIIDLNWLLTGEGEMFLTGDITQSGKNNQLVIAGGSVNGSNNINMQTSKNSTAREVKPYLREELVNVPYVSIDAKASFVESLYNNTYEEETYGIMAEGGEELNDTEYKVFQIDGDSMTPSIPDKSKVLARIIPDTKWEEASGVVLVVYSKTLTIKRVLKNSLFDKNFITLKADNPIHGQVDVERKEIRGMWQAIRIVSQRII